MSFSKSLLGLLIVAVLAGTGCSKCLKHYQSAVANYNAGAEIRLKADNMASQMGSWKMDAPDITPIQTAAGDEADTYYQKAINFSADVDKCASKLAAANAHGNALTIESLAQWQMRDYDACMSSRQKALAAFDRDSKPHTREEEIMAAFPGLVHMQELDDQTVQLEAFVKEQAGDIAGQDETTRRKTYEEKKAIYQEHVLNNSSDGKGVIRTLRYFTEAIENGDRTNEDFRRILAYGMMITLRNWSEMNTRMDMLRRAMDIPEDSEKNMIKAQVDTLFSSLNDYKNIIKQTLPDGANDPNYKKWDRNLRTD